MSRSFLFAPGDRPELLAKSRTAGADAVVFDLEDAVRPEHKTTARQNVLEALAAATTGEPGAPIWVRVNALEGDLWRDDVTAVVTAGAQGALVGLRIPKSESRRELEALDQLLREVELGVGLTRGSVAVTCTIESALGLWRIDELMRAPRVVRLAFGAADFVADLGAAPVPEATLYARSQVVLASRVAGLLPPIAPVYTRLDDDEGLRRRCEEDRDLGFGGRSCIHPRQLATIHQVFTPDTAALARAREVLRAAEAADGGGTLAGGEFVDAAVVRRARALIAAASVEEGDTVDDAVKDDVVRGMP